MDISFRSLIAGDLPLLCAWLNKPHMRRFYQKTPITIQETAVKFLPRILGHQPTHDHMVCIGGEPFGKLQCYRNMDYPDYANEVRLSGGVSVDLFIGEAEMMGRGLGRAMLRKYVQEIVFPSFVQEGDCYICHDLENLAARACSRAAGFIPVGLVTEEAVASELFVFKRTAC